MEDHFVIGSSLLCFFSSSLPFLSFCIPLFFLLTHSSLLYSVECSSIIDSDWFAASLFILHTDRLSFQSSAKNKCSSFTLLFTIMNWLHSLPNLHLHLKCSKNVKAGLFLFQITEALFKEIISTLLHYVPNSHCTVFSLIVVFCLWSHLTVYVPHSSSIQSNNQCSRLPC